TFSSIGTSSGSRVMGVFHVFFTAGGGGSATRRLCPPRAGPPRAPAAPRRARVRRGAGPPSFFRRVPGASNPPGAANESPHAEPVRLGVAHGGDLSLPGVDALASVGADPRRGVLRRGRP